MKKIIIIAAILGVLFGGFKLYEFNKSERQREATNYENLLKEYADALQKSDSVHDAAKNTFIEYSFRKNKELKDYLESTSNQLNGLTKKLDDANIKLKRITQIASTSVNARDSSVTKINIDSLAYKMSSLTSFSVPFIDKTPCFEFSGRLMSDGVQSSIVIDYRNYTDTVTRIDHWYRDKHNWVLGIPTRLFGKKILKRTEFSKCASETKTIIIKKGKK